MNVLSVRGLSKTYPGGTVALRDVSFDVAEGEFLVVIGLSGSGKTTLLRCLNRLHEPSAGEILFAGRDVRSLSPREVRRQVAMIFQQFNLVPRLSARTNVLTGGLATRSLWRTLLFRASPDEIARAEAELDRVGLLPRRDHRADQLSGGQQQRVAIARALFQNPRVLLADEPVASLDPQTAGSVMDHLRRANRERGLTVICNLHFLSLVREYATRVIALRDGRLVFSGSPNEIDAEWFRRIYGEEARDIGVR